jgi:hypothetical protein
MAERLNVGQLVKVNSPGHRVHGRTAKIEEVGTYIPGYRIKVDGRYYLILPSEAEPTSALKEMVWKLDKKPRDQTGYITQIPEIQDILSEITPRVSALVAHTGTHGPKQDISVQITIGFTLERDLL